jgi:hypothetical protein
MRRSSVQRAILDTLENIGGGDASERRDFKSVSGKIGSECMVSEDVGWDDELR